MKKIFKVSVSAIQKREKENLESKKLNRGFKKIDPPKLKEYIAKHPDTYQIEFGCTATAIRKAFKRLGVTRKKRPKSIKSKTKKKYKFIKSK